LQPFLLSLSRQYPAFLATVVIWNSVQVSPITNTGPDRFERDFRSCIL